MKRLALFDLDGTITNKDTFLEFLRFVSGTRRYYFGMLKISPFLVFYKAGLYPNWKAKEKALTEFLAGKTAADIKEAGRVFCASKYAGLLRENAVLRLKEHIQQGDDVYIVSASCEEWVEPWASSLGVRAICTKLAKKNDRITGRIHGKNNYGPEKYRRVKEEIDLSRFEEIHVYGDSRGDREMLSIATHAYYRYF